MIVFLEAKIFNVHNAVYKSNASLHCCLYWARLKIGILWMNYKLDAYIMPFKFTQSVRFKLRQNTRIRLRNVQTKMKQLHPAYT